MDPCEPEAHRGRRFSLGVGLLAIAVLAIGVWVGINRRTRQAAQPVELLRSDLLLREGRLCRTAVSAPFTGTMIERYPDGSLQSRSRVVDGLLEGLSEAWHTNGQLQVQEHFVRGVSHGLRTKWYPDGATQSLASIVEGRLEGTFLRWHENGTLAEQAEMRHGQPEGLSQAYYPSGDLKARARVREGQVVERQFWNDGDQPAGPAAPAKAR